ncbi:pantoate--beta-alanine ligase, partial [Xanthomonas axonopodis]
GTPRVQVEETASHTLEQAGFRVDYAVVRLPDLSEPGDSHTGARVALIAARLGNTRLIDNLEF